MGFEDLVRVRPQQLLKAAGIGFGVEPQVLKELEPRSSRRGLRGGAGSTFRFTIPK